jgi:uncharacterized membrane protein
MYDMLILALPGPNNSSSMALGLNSEGDVAGWAAEPDAGVIWHAGSVDFALPAQSASQLFDVNSSGDAVGVLGETDPTGAALVPVLVRNGVVHDLTPVLGKGSAVLSINEAGLVCGSSYKSKAFVYDSHENKVIRWIDPLPGIWQYSTGQAINGNGDVAGNNYGFPDRGYFCDFDGTLKDLGSAYVSGLNDSRIVVGSRDIPSWRAVIWDANEASPAATELPLPEGSTYSLGLGINNYGDVVGTCGTSSNVVGQSTRSVFIYSHSDQVSTDVKKLISDPQQWDLADVEAINDKGQIVGYGDYKGKGLRAFLLEPVLLEPGPPGLTFPEHIDTDLPVSFEEAFGTVLVDGRGWIISLKGGPPQPAPPPPRSWMRLNAAKRGALMGLVMDELAMYISDARTREKVRVELLERVRASVDRLMQSVAESGTSSVGNVPPARVTPELQARMDKIFMRLGRRSRTAHRRP